MLDDCSPDWAAAGAEEMVRVALLRPIQPVDTWYEKRHRSDVMQTW